ncbi:MAG: hypothetical protein WBH73_08725 [Arcanobacterium sp.]
MARIKKINPAVLDYFATEIKAMEDRSTELAKITTAFEQITTARHDIATARQTLTSLGMSARAIEDVLELNAEDRRIFRASQTPPAEQTHPEEHHEYN